MIEAMAGPSTALEPTCIKFGQHDAQERRRDGHQQRARAYPGDRHLGGKALGRHEVYKPAPWELADEPRNTPNSQDQPDVSLVPLLCGEVDCEERAKPCLDVGHEKREPIKTAFTLSGREFHGRVALAKGAKGS